MSKPFKYVAIINNAMNFFIISAWDNDISAPGFVKKNAIIARYVNKLFDIHSRNVVDAKELLSEQHKNIQLARHSFRRAAGYRGKNLVSDADRVIKSFVYDGLETIDTKEALMKELAYEIKEYRKRGLECYGVFLNTYEDLENLYLHNVGKDFPSIPVTNKVTDVFNILVIRDRLLDVFVAYPWRESSSFSKQELLSGDYFVFKRWLLEFTHYVFPELGSIKNARRRQWCEERFFKLLNGDIEGLSIENIPLPNAKCMADTVARYKDLLLEESPQKVINFPQFATMNKMVLEVGDLINDNRNIASAASQCMLKLLTSKQWVEEDFYSITENSKNDFSQLPDTSYKRTANSSSDELSERRYG